MGPQYSHHPLQLSLSAIQVHGSQHSFHRRSRHFVRNVKAARIRDDTVIDAEPSCPSTQSCVAGLIYTNLIPISFSVRPRSVPPPSAQDRIDSRITKHGHIVVFVERVGGVVELKGMVPGPRC
jgi:hypothetical protein